MRDIFLDNKYTRWYHAVIERRVTTPAPIEGYRESHHIIPESFYIARTREGPAGWLTGNPDAAENKVWLTGREHALCHWLLVKMTEGLALIKCRQAFDMMASDNDNMNRKVSRMITRAYERNRIEVAKIRSERMLEVNPMDNVESRKKVSDSKRNKKRGQFSDEWIANLCKSNSGEGNGMYGKSHKEDSIAQMKVSASMKAWVNNKVSSLRINKADLQKYLDDGWLRGRHYISHGTRGPYKKRQAA